ncbi:toprim domain-containing protein [Domibacillus sp. DTU_2020_1001157_1_SI_ALB_TIR_016]|uniref:toprim domain-containing protein n=1 Tax=Domibacillus sp. DTU_2020_1001157_1_SI_ALB_TIR_016 TaxID=3077789 RepID=UPI0028EC6482|nr:toprim domain-containing protein [Domibacillus sp. DTU_2020_1001157_1_SI_ALB_TIR_016]WNS81588.1 toprim domain-containing protein [Domibacillus sp. DTU_2020_1001157_1_SI_ALB_TIR_016]
MMMVEKTIIVEGSSDRKRVAEIVKEPVDIICTNGTIGVARLDDLVEQLFERDVYILVDADASGEKLRQQFKRELPHARHLYIDRGYKEVAAAPHRYLAALLMGADIDVRSEYLQQEGTHH